MEYIILKPYGNCSSCPFQSLSHSEPKNPVLIQMGPTWTCCLECSQNKRIFNSFNMHQSKSLHAHRNFNQWFQQQGHFTGYNADLPSKVCKALYCLISTMMSGSLTVTRSSISSHDLNVLDILVGTSTLPVVSAVFTSKAKLKLWTLIPTGQSHIMIPA